MLSGRAALPLLDYLATLEWVTATESLLLVGLLGADKSQGD
jgi:hypothetical protein